EEFLWVGNAAGRKPQLVLTTDRPEYLLNSESKNKWAIGEIIREIEKRQLKDKDIRNLCKVLQEIKERFFTKNKSLIHQFENVLKHEGIEASDIALYTIAVKRHGKITDLVKMQGYKKFLHFVLFETQSTISGRCHICGEEKDVLVKPAYPEGTVLFQSSVFTILIKLDLFQV
ncbi:MAG: TM1802 family CRISPR-associated protein, partial [Thermoproteota archaeon]